MENYERVDLKRSCTVLREKLLRLLPDEGNYSTPVKGVGIHRYNSDSAPRPRMYKPMLIVIAQGKKWTKLGNDEYIYGEHHYFVSGISMPVSSCMLGISAERPYLALSLDLDKNLIAHLAAEVPPLDGQRDYSPRGALVQELEPAMLDAFLRLVELAETPERIKILEPMVIKELHLRLLTGPFGNQLRTIHTHGSQANQIARAISWLLGNFKEPLNVEALAEQLNMATSTFHKHFKEVTTISPLQYQKRLRLQEAQRLMLREDYDVTRAAFAVGYESQTQFSREYKRQFGEPPQKDIANLRKPSYYASTWTAAY